MRQRVAMILCAAAAIAAAAAWLTAGDGARATLAPGTPAFPNLAARLGDARTVEIVRASGVLRIVRDDAGTWSLPDHAGYPVEPAALHALLAGLAGLRLMEPRTNDPDFFAALGVQDPGNDNTGALVRVLDGDRAPLAAIILGHPDHAAAADMMVRRPGERQTFLADADLSVPGAWLDWVAPTVADIAPEDVASFVSTRAGGGKVALRRAGQHMALADPPPARTLDAFRLDDSSRALTGLAMLDVRHADQVPGVPAGEATVTTTGGLTVTADVWRDGADAWIGLAAQGDSPEAAALQDRWRGWAFRIDARRADELLPDLPGLAGWVPVAGPSALLAKPKRH